MPNRVVSSSRAIGRGRVLGSFPSDAPSPPSRERSSTLDVFRAVDANESLHDASTSSRDRSQSNFKAHHLPVAPFVSNHAESGSQLSVTSGEFGGGEADTIQLACPICNEGMITLAQLNRHLDDEHQDLEIQEQDKVKSWFFSLQSKPKSFPLSPLFTFLRESGEAVEAIGNSFAPNIIPSQPGKSSSRNSSSEPIEHISRTHFQHLTSGSRCSSSMCRARLGGHSLGNNCRKCGRLFCERHLVYEMKLSYQAAHDPDRGQWFRVCSSCYVVKEGYNDYDGAFRDHSSVFARYRKPVVEKSRLETGRLETRLTKLTQAVAALPTDQLKAPSFWALPNSRLQAQKAAEQSVVLWENDSSVSNCPFCLQSFSTYSLRRHHCRLCGRVVCASPSTQCSSEIGLQVSRAASSLSSSIKDKPSDTVNIDTRVCKDCSHILFYRADFLKDVADTPKVRKLFLNLREFESGIKLLLPSFQRHLQLLQDESKNISPTQLQDATHTHKVLANAFSQYERVSRMIQALPAESRTSKILHRSVFQQAYDFLHLHAGPLKTSSTLLVRRAKAAKEATGLPNGLSRTDSPSSTLLSRLNLLDRGEDGHSVDFETGSHTMSAAASSIAQAEAEEHDLRERLIVLEEQHFFVTQMMADAEGRRAFDEMSSLSRNLEDLTAEINSLKGQLEKIDFAALYQAEASFLPQLPAVIIMIAERDDDSAPFLQTAPYLPPKLLPATRYRDEILYLIETTPVTVVVGQTGSGKTTQIPQFLAGAGWCDDGKQIAVTQPRRVAAVSVAARVAEEMDSPIGQTVGYSIRFEDKTSSQTKIKFLTDGMLLREALVDPLFSQYSVIMIDEAHERSLSSDMLLGLLKKVLKRRPDLRIVISSATIQADVFLSFFATEGDASHANQSGVDSDETAQPTARAISIEGRSYPVTVQYLAEPPDDYVERAVQTVMDIHTIEGPGDILVFLTGREEIESACDMIADRLHDTSAPTESSPSSSRLPDSLILCPLYAGLPSDQQMKVFDRAPDGCRKVIVATNIAEASVTIDGVCFVVDSGFVKLRSYNPLTGIEILTAVPISQASAIQRAGRAGRTKAGKCFRLYSESVYRHVLSPTTVPEIQRSNLTSLILQLKALGIDNVARFGYLTPPPPELFIRALELLFALGALDDYGKLTRPLGLQMAELSGVSPMMAKSLLAAPRFECLQEMLSIAAMMSVDSPIWVDGGNRKGMDSARRQFAVEEGDHLTALNVFNAFAAVARKGNWGSGDRERGNDPAGRWCSNHGLNHKSMQQAVNIRRQLAGFLDRFGLSEKGWGGWDGTESTAATRADSNDGASKAERIRRCLTSGYFAYAARMRPDGTFLPAATPASASSTSAPVILHAHPSSLLFNRKAEWVIFGELVASGKDKVFIKDVTKIEKDWLVEYGKGFYKVVERR